MSEARLTVTPQVARLSIVDGPEAALRVVVQTARLELRSEGVQGATGPAGPASAFYEHTQASSSASWTIAHNLGFRPTVTVLTTGGLEVLADVQHLSVNTLTVTLLAPMAGTARLT